MGGQLVKLTQPTANVEQPGYPITAAIDGKNDTGWAVQVPVRTSMETNPRPSRLKLPSMRMATRR